MFTVEYSDSLENALMKVVAMNRSNVDFVDKVWELLKCENFFLIYALNLAVATTICFVNSGSELYGVGYRVNGILSTYV